MLTVETISEHMGLYISTIDADAYVVEFAKAMIDKTGMYESDVAAILKPITVAYQTKVVRIDTRRMAERKDADH